MTNISDHQTDAQVRKVTWVGLIVNILLAGTKAAAGIVGNSQAVVADAVHSFTDSVTDLAVIIGSYYWGKPADACHPYGHKRLETIVTIFIGVVLIAAAAGIGWNAIAALQQPQAHSPGWVAAAAAAVSIVCKEILYQWTVRVGKRLNSLALSANAWHHRLDALSSIPALIAVGGAILFPDWIFLDSIGAIVVSLFIFQAALKIIFQGFRELIDAGAPPSISREIKEIALKNTAVVQVHGVRTRYHGNRLQVDLHIVVASSLTVKQGHDIADDVQRRILGEGPDVVDVVVHVEPLESAIPEAT